VSSLAIAKLSQTKLANSKTFARAEHYNPFNLQFRDERRPIGMRQC